MANNYCKSCGKPISPEDKFCSNCAAPTTQEGYKAPQAPTPPLTPTSRLGASFWLGLIAGIFGIFIGTIVVGIALAFGTWTWEIGWPFVGLIVFSIIGIVGALRIVDKRDTINAGLLIIAGVGVLVSIKTFGIFSALLFFIGAALLYLKKG